MESDLPIDDRWMPVFVALFPIIFVAMWAFVIALIARMGWSRLAEYYRATGDPSPEARRFHWRSLTIGAAPFSANYSSCINAWFDRDGLYLRPTLLFRLFHPMLFFRWTDIGSVEEQRRLMFRHVALRLKRDVPEIRLTGGLGKALLGEWARIAPQSRTRSR